MQKIVMKNQKYGRLLILSEIGKFVEALCECGTTDRYMRSNVLAGYTQSCGCLRNERTSGANTTHGQTGNPTYLSWKAMKRRCDNPQYGYSHRYSERGIAYDPRWSAYENFFSDMGERPQDHELDRIDNNKGYFKENCRWATHKQNCNNRGY